MKFKVGQLVSRKGYTSSPYVVIGYNAMGMVIVTPTQDEFSFSSRTVFAEIELRDASQEDKDLT
jgi:hypothetical protein